MLDQYYDAVLDVMRKQKSTDSDFIRLPAIAVALAKYASAIGDIGTSIKNLQNLQAMALFAADPVNKEYVDAIFKFPSVMSSLLPDVSGTADPAARKEAIEIIFKALEAATKMPPYIAKAMQ